MDTAAHEKIRLNRHVPRLGRSHKIIQDLVRHRLMEGAFVAIAPEIKLQAFQLDTELVGNIVDADRRKIRLTGLGTKTREFRTFHFNFIIPVRIRILEDIELFRRLSAHACIISQAFLAARFKRGAKQAQIDFWILFS